MKYKAKIFYNLVEEVELEADSYRDAQDKAREYAGTGKTIMDEIDFVEVDEVEEEAV